MSVGVEVKRIRQLALLTQEDFAKSLNVSFTTVNRWENGKGKPSMTAMKSLRAFCTQHDIPYEGLRDAWCDNPENNTL